GQDRRSNVGDEFDAPVPGIGVAEATDPAHRRAALRERVEAAIAGAAAHAVLRAPRIFPRLAEPDAEQQRQDGGHAICRPHWPSSSIAQSPLGGGPRPARANVTMTAGTAHITVGGPASGRKVHASARAGTARNRKMQFLARTG